MSKIELTEGIIQESSSELQISLILLKKGFNGDDIFDKEGNYLGRTDEGNFLIRILTTDVTFEEAAADLNTNNQLLTQFRYCKEDKLNREALLKIVNYYGKQAGLDQAVQLFDVDTIKEPDAAGAFAFWHLQRKTFNFCVNTIEGTINLHANNYNNVIVSLGHEKMHKVDERTKKILLHVDVVIQESNNSNFSNTTHDFKRSRGMYAADLLNRALLPSPLNKGVTLKDVLDKIDQFNESEMGKFFTLEYKVDSKIVQSGAKYEGVIINGKKSKK